MKDEAKSKAELLREIKLLKKRVKELEKTGKHLNQCKEKIANEYILFRTLLDNIPDHIYFKDLESKFIVINKDLAKRYRIDNPEYAIGKTDFDFFTEEHAQQAFDDEQLIIKTGTPKINFIEKETWENGKITYVLTTKMPLKNEKNEIIGTFGISRDITKLREMQSELSERAKELECSNTDLEQFAFVASHDLQEPLRMIQSYGKLLEHRYKDKLDDTASDFIWYIVDGAERMV